MNTAKKLNYDNHMAEDLKSKASSRALLQIDPLNSYLYEIKKYKLLTPEEQRELAIRFKEKDDQNAAQMLVLSNLRLVLKIALDFQRVWMQNLLDLIQEGNIGLMQAAMKFDPYRGVKFSYYASFWIRAYMLKFLMENLRLVKIGTTQDQRKLFFRLSKERELLRSQGFEAGPRLLAERLDVKEEEIEDMTQRLANPEASLDAPRGGEDGRESYSEALPAPEDEVDEKIFEKARRRAFRDKLKQYRARLTGRKAYIFDHRIMTEDPLTLEEIGKKFDISRERVRQIESGIVGEIKKTMRKELPEYTEEESVISGQ